MLSYPDDEKQVGKSEYSLSSLVPEERRWEGEVRLRWDNFLDAYSQYMKEHNSLSQKVLERKALEVELVDPTFHFTVS